MKSELKKRKKRFWVLCLSLMLALYNVMPMVVFAAAYDADLKKESGEGYVFDLGSEVVPEDTVKFWYFEGFSSHDIVYFDFDGTTLYSIDSSEMKDNLDANGYYTHTVKGYSGKKPEQFKAWKVTDISRSGGPVDLGHPECIQLIRFTAVPYVESNITYNLDGGTNASTNPATYYEGKEAISLADASKEGYAFEGWYSDDTFTTKVTSISTEDTGDKTFYAKFTKCYDITYELDGGKNGEGNPTSYNVGTGVKSFADAGKDGYTFEGWYSDKTFTTKVTSISAEQTGDVTLYAKFAKNAPKSYAITYELDGGKNGEGNPTSYNVGTGVKSFADASKEGYTFEGWFSDAAFTAKVTSISATQTGNITLYAKFTKKAAESYTITYVLDGGINGEGNPTSYTVGTGVTSFADASKEGYSFEGWYSDAAFTTKVTSISTTQTGNITLYAKFVLLPEEPDQDKDSDPDSDKDSDSKPDSDSESDTGAQGTSNNSSSGNRVKDDVPKTGDDMMNLWPVAVMVLSGAGVAVIMGKKRKVSEDNTL